MALLGGIGGGITRDVMVAEVPAALKNPAYITLCLAAEVVGYRIAAASSRANHSASCATWGCWWRNQMPRGPTGPGTNKGPVGRDPVIGVSTTSSPSSRSEDGARPGCA